MTLLALRHLDPPQIQTTSVQKVFVSGSAVSDRKLGEEVILFKLWIMTLRQNRLFVNALPSGCEKKFLRRFRMPLSRFVASLAEDRWKVWIFDQARLPGCFADHVESRMKPIETFPGSLFAFNRQAMPRNVVFPSSLTETMDSLERSER